MSIILSGFRITGDDHNQEKQARFCVTREPVHQTLTLCQVLEQHHTFKELTVVEFPDNYGV